MLENYLRNKIKEIELDKKHLSAMLILTDGKKFLICKPYGNNQFWDLPKGLKEENESTSITVKRETQEETGLIFSDHEYVFLTYSSYTPTKDLAIYTVRKSKLPDITLLKCTSLFDGIHPEICDYKYILFSEIDKYLTPNMQRVISENHRRFFLKNPNYERKKD